MQSLNTVYYKKEKSRFYGCHLYSPISQNFLNEVLKPYENNIFIKMRKTSIVFNSE